MRNLDIMIGALLRHTLRCFYELKAKLLRRTFICDALQGLSEYNISINCDMTVSCNCQDDGSGILGSLDDSSFEEIFFGPTANAFRTSLAGGKLPILTCARCSELKRAPAVVDSCQMIVDKGAADVCGNPASLETPTTNIHQLATPSMPRLPYRGLLVENTIACNLHCPGCIRPAVGKIRKKPCMSLDDVRKVAELIRRMKLQKLFYFNRGEPFLSPDILDEMSIIRELNPDLHIVTSTNGMLLNTDAKREAALLMDEVVFSIDGCDQRSLQRYQRGGDFERMLNNLWALVQFRNDRGLKLPQIEWKYLLFNWNDRPRQISKAICLASGQGSAVRGQRSDDRDSQSAVESLTTINYQQTTTPASPSADLISFWPTNNPARGISWRYRLGFLNRIGAKSWKGREVWLRDNALGPKQ